MAKNFKQLLPKLKSIYADYPETGHCYLVFKFMDGNFNYDDMISFKDELIKKLKAKLPLDKTLPKVEFEPEYIGKVYTGIVVSLPGEKMVVALQFLPDLSPLSQAYSRESAKLALKALESMTDFLSTELTDIPLKKLQFKLTYRPPEEAAAKVGNN